MMQLDKTRLLEPWLRHHGMLFGFENLVMLDNGSRSADVLATLSRYEQANIPGRAHMFGAAGFLDKGLHVARLIAERDRAGGYDFALPMDYNEFLGLFEERDSAAVSTLSTPPSTG